MSDDAMRTCRETNMLMKILAMALLVGAGWCASAQAAAIDYSNDFEKAEVGKVPDDFLVLDGQFAVKEEEGNRFLELPGAPLDTFGVLFGPTEKDGLAASARIYGTGKGRRYPAFAVSLNGVSGYKLQVTPAKKLVEIYKGDTVKASVPFEWVSAK